MQCETDVVLVPRKLVAVLLLHESVKIENCCHRRHRLY